VGTLSYAQNTNLDGLYLLQVQYSKCSGIDHVPATNTENTQTKRVSMMSGNLLKTAEMQTPKRRVYKV
jgi:hypothetical protein